MGCKSLTYSNFGTSLKVVHRDFSMIPKSCASVYRYGFNGMESDDEVKGDGNSYTTEFRQYDPRIGRWLSLDPLMAKYPNQSPYVAFNNNPIYFSDPNGLEGDPPYSITGGVISGVKVTNEISSVTERPKMKVITGVVLHRTVSSNAEGAVRTTKSNKGTTGFHVVIDKEGSLIQVNNLENRANHVGKQKGDIGNFNSIGIEVVGMPVDANGNPSMTNIAGWEALTQEQIEATAQATYSILKEYGLGIEDIYPHEDVSWKTTGEGQTVIDAIRPRLEELFNPPAAETGNNNTPSTISPPPEYKGTIQDNTRVDPSYLPSKQEIKSPVVSKKKK